MRFDKFGQSGHGRDKLESLLAIVLGAWFTFRPDRLNKTTTVRLVLLLIGSAGGKKRTAE